MGPLPRYCEGRQDGEGAVKSRGELMTERTVSMSEEQARAIISSLEEKGCKNICPMCGNKKFELIPGIFINVLQGLDGDIHLDGPSVRVIVVICDRCGFVSQHSVSKLGLSFEES